MLPENLHNGGTHVDFDVLDTSLYRTIVDSSSDTTRYLVAYRPITLIPFALSGTGIVPRGLCASDFAGGRIHDQAYPPTCREHLRRRRESIRIPQKDRLHHGQQGCSLCVACRQQQHGHIRLHRHFGQPRYPDGAPGNACTNRENRSGTITRLTAGADGGDGGDGVSYDTTRADDSLGDKVNGASGGNGGSGGKGSNGGARGLVFCLHVAQEFVSHSSAAASEVKRAMEVALARTDPEVPFSMADEDGNIEFPEP